MNRKQTIYALLIGLIYVPFTFAQESTLNQFSKKALKQVEFGEYAVGSKIIFARDNSQRFDPWNTAYASSEYRKLLRKIESSGQPRTVPIHVWYPALVSDETIQIHQRLRSPKKAVSGKQAKFSDYVLNDSNAFEPLTMSLNTNLKHIEDTDDQPLANLPSHKMNQALKQFIEAFVKQDRGAFIDAPIAKGTFPLIILSHGLGGNYAMWDRAGEFLASHGYVAVAPTYISDGTVPIVFHDPASEFAKAKSPSEVGEAYQTLSEMKVLPNFFRYLFGIENPTQATILSFDPTKSKVLNDGPNKVVDMQRNLFRQRVVDLGIVKDTLVVLNKDKEHCRNEAQGSVVTSCGQFSGKLDIKNIGLSGPSLGSMTSQLALKHIPNIQTAIGLNNGVPYSWTPQEMFGGDYSEDGVPIGNSKPLLQIIGNEDDFVQMVFHSIFQEAVTLAEGDPSTLLQLPAERAEITKENPQPVALSAYNRAQGDKMLVTVADVDHGVLTQHDAEFNFPGYVKQNGESLFSYVIDRNRKATGRDLFTPNFMGESFSLLSWGQTEQGQWYYKPHVIRDYYYLNWFDYYLKKDPAAKKKLLTSPFSKFVSLKQKIN
ncbi:hypothetical protein [Vibrio sp. Sgm 5]|uniref:alpha/beta hydrolase n=1 Tax=Vibrio sp. Sgm 5 TaxID=2994387 RepID=UPI0022497CE0|nr:hypothetical protein [Vibrio sp. Sgm 5]MCX2792481.1 hypothetical protein [Vibrio sp. Sgm 5]